MRLKYRNTMILAFGFSLAACLAGAGEPNLPVNNDYHQQTDTVYPQPFYPVSPFEQPQIVIGSTSPSRVIYPESGRNLPVDNNYHRWYDDKYGPGMYSQYQPSGIPYSPVELRVPTRNTPRNPKRNIPVDNDYHVQTDRKYDPDDLRRIGEDPALFP
jgi:hypothetical protein